MLRGIGIEITSVWFALGLSAQAKPAPKFDASCGGSTCTGAAFEKNAVDPQVRIDAGSTSSTRASGPSARQSADAVSMLRFLFGFSRRIEKSSDLTLARLRGSSRYTVCCPQPLTLSCLPAAPGARCQQASPSVPPPGSPASSQTGLRPCSPQPTKKSTAEGL